MWYMSWICDLILQIPSSFPLFEFVDSGSEAQLELKESLFE